MVCCLERRILLLSSEAPLRAPRSPIALFPFPCSEMPSTRPRSLLHYLSPLALCTAKTDPKASIPLLSERRTGRRQSVRAMRTLQGRSGARCVAEPGGPRPSARRDTRKTLQQRKQVPRRARSAEG